ncbi:MAG TPA: cytochrome c nitrite reductase small subunit [Blastocatellia bacterium]|nr:cytochrome c nitrite reductase small subunit [Blastocatellia bacterium]
MKKRSLPITICALLIGTAAGLGIYTFVYAKGGSYLTNNPAACANCHIMQSQYDAWQKSSHHAVATCNDCHTPAGFFGKYLTKASNGFWHSFAFTTGQFHEPIQIKARNRAIADHACRKCHAEIIESIEGLHQVKNAEPLSCLRCHGAVGHPQ